MALTLWALLEAGLLVVNAICVLHEKRFLAKSKSEFLYFSVEIPQRTNQKICDLFLEVIKYFS